MAQAGLQAEISGCGSSELSISVQYGAVIWQSHHDATVGHGSMYVANVEWQAPSRRAHNCQHWYGLLLAEDFPGCLGPKALVEVSYPAICVDVGK